MKKADDVTHHVIVGHSRLGWLNNWFRNWSTNQKQLFGQPSRIWPTVMWCVMSSLSSV